MTVILYVLLVFIVRRGDRNECINDTSIRRCPEETEPYESRGGVQVPIGRLPRRPVPRHTSAGPETNLRGQSPGYHRRIETKSSGWCTSCVAKIKSQGRRMAGSTKGK